MWCSGICVSSGVKLYNAKGRCHAFGHVRCSWLEEVPVWQGTLPPAAYSTLTQHADFLWDSTTTAVISFCSRLSRNSIYFDEVV